MRVVLPGFRASRTADTAAAVLSMKPTHLHNNDNTIKNIHMYMPLYRQIHTGVSDANDMTELIIMMENTND